MLETITRALQEASSGSFALPLAFMLGLVSAAASACCTLPIMGLLVAYSGTRETPDRRSTVIAAIWFSLGTASALIILGLVAGSAGQAAQILLGRYWKIFAGVIAVVVGLGTLKLIPLPSFSKRSGAAGTGSPHGTVGAALGGLFLGGAVAASSLPCNPGILIVLGAAVLQGRMIWGMALMAAYAVGFSLPLAAILLGVSFGKASVKAAKADAMIRGTAGVLLIGAGLYLLSTF